MDSPQYLQGKRCPPTENIRKKKTATKLTPSEGFDHATSQESQFNQTI